jgi:hypothetical protein
MAYKFIVVLLSNELSTEVFLFGTGAHAIDRRLKTREYRLKYLLSGRADEDLTTKTLRHNSVSAFVPLGLVVKVVGKVWF